MKVRICTLFFLTQFCILSIAQSDSYLEKEARENGSLISIEQAQDFAKLFVESGVCNTRATALLINHDLLRPNQLPEIDVNSDDYKSKIARMIGPFSSTIIGSEFSDGKYRYCLPCTLTLNNFFWGIFRDDSSNSVQRNSNTKNQLGTSR